MLTNNVPKIKSKKICHTNLSPRQGYLSFLVYEARFYDQKKGYVNEEFIFNEYKSCQCTYTRHIQEGNYAHRTLVNDYHHEAQATVNRQFSSIKDDDVIPLRDLLLKYS